MSITAQIYGALRQGSRRLFTSGPQSFDLNLGGEQLFSQVLPPRAELVRLGRSFSAQIPAANAFTLLITIPSTRAELALQNPNATATKTCLIIERFWIKNVTSEASAGELTPLSQLVASGTTLVADNTAVLRTNLAGKAASPTATLCIASTATGAVTDKWNHHASKTQPETTNIAACIEVNCFGKYIVPPGGIFNINAQESVSGGTAIAGIEWHEVEMDVG